MESGWGRSEEGERGDGRDAGFAGFLGHEAKTSARSLIIGMAA